jgi:hypothetical protein
MVRLAVVLALMFFTITPLAHAEYYFDFAQFDEAGHEIERGTWSCLNSDVKANRCTHDVMLVIDGKPQPVEMRFKDDGGNLRITMAAGARRIEARTRKSLNFRRKSTIASSIEAWQMDENQREAPAEERLLLDDLVLRHHLLATLTLVVARVPR